MIMITFKNILFDWLYIDSSHFDIIHTIYTIFYFLFHFYSIIRVISSWHLMIIIRTVYCLSCKAFCDLSIYNIIFNFYQFLAFFKVFNFGFIHFQSAINLMITFRVKNLWYLWDSIELTEISKYVCIHLEC